MAVRSEINITPFIDVLLVLIIIFMMIAPRMVITSQVSQENGSASENAPLVLELTSDGRYLLNTIPIGAESLATTLRDVFAVRPVKVLFVKVASQRIYQEAIRMMDVARGAGVEVLSLAP